METRAPATAIRSANDGTGSMQWWWSCRWCLPRVAGRHTRAPSALTSQIPDVPTWERRAPLWLELARQLLQNRLMKGLANRLFVAIVAWLGLISLACGGSTTVGSGTGGSGATAGRGGSGVGGTTGAGGDARGDAASCYPLFHACATNAECCAPNRCLNITGTLECQQEGPAADGGDGTSDGPTQPDARGGCFQNGVHYNVGDIFDVACNVCDCPPDGVLRCSTTVCLPDGGYDGAGSAS